MKIDLHDLGRIGVLLGGPSNERDISLKSGKAVLGCLKHVPLDTVAIDVQTASFDENRRLIQEANIDIAFIALHGCFGEDGQIQALLEEMDIPYTGSNSTASRFAMDKFVSRKMFQEQKLRVPNCVVLSLRDGPGAYARVMADLTSPFVVKPASQGSSIGLSIVESEKQLKQAIEHAIGFDERIIIEEYIPGREITVGILGKSALPIIEILPGNKFYDYEAKYEVGKSNYVVPADLSKDASNEVTRIAIAAHQALGCSGFSRVDMRLNPDNVPVILEINSIPGLTQTSLLPKAAMAAGLNFQQLCLKILYLAYERCLKNRLLKNLQ